MKNSRTRILFLIDTLSRGGTENQLILLSENLSRSHFEPTIATLYKTNHQDTFNINTPILNFNLSGPPFFRNMSLIWRLKRYLDKEKVDILQSHFAESEIYGTMAARLSQYRPTLIATRRDLYHWINDEPWMFRISRRTVHWSDLVLVNSYRTLELCKKMERIPEGKIKVIQNGIVANKFNNTPTVEAKKIIGLEGEYPVVGVVGNWQPIKGLTYFLEAAVLVSKKIPKARFVLAGFGPQENELRSLVQDLGIYQRVLFLRSPTDIPMVMAAFDIAVQPSLSESFTNVLLEYMAAAKPIVATKVGDAEKVIEDGKDGLLIEPENPHQLTVAILSLYNNRARAEEMGRLAREKVVANWSHEKMVEKYQLLYHELVNRKRDKN